MSKTIKLIDENMGKHFMITRDFLNVTQSIGHNNSEVD